MAAIAAPVMARTCSRVLIASADPILRQRVIRSRRMQERSVRKRWGEPTRWRNCCRFPATA